MKTTLFTLSLLTATLAAPATFAGHEVNASAGLTAKGGALAMRGFDPVELVERRAVRRGLATQATTHRGVTYRFATAENLAMFERAPERYSPRFGGYCAYGVSVGKKFDGDPNLFRVVGGRLYFVLNEEIAAAFDKDPAGAIAKAERNWKKIRSTKPSDL